MLGAENIAPEQLISAGETAEDLQPSWGTPAIVIETTKRLLFCIYKGGYKLNTTDEVTSGPEHVRGSFWIPGTCIQNKLYLVPTWEKNKHVVW